MFRGIYIQNTTLAMPMYTEVQRYIECYFGVCFPRCCTTRKINTQISCAHEQFVTRVHTSIYFLHDIMNP